MVFRRKRPGHFRGVPHFDLLDLVIVEEFGVGVTVVALIYKPFFGDYVHVQGVGTSVQWELVRISCILVIELDFGTDGSLGD